MTDKPYVPRGKVIPLLDAMHREPDRVFTQTEAAGILGVPAKGVMAMVNYALRAQVIYTSKDERGRRILKGSPFAGQPIEIPARHNAKALKSKGGTWTPHPDDLRIPRVVPGWKPPQMVCVRLEANDSRRKAA